MKASLLSAVHRSVLRKVTVVDVHNLQGPARNANPSRSPPCQETSTVPLVVLLCAIRKCEPLNVCSWTVTELTRSYSTLFQPEKVQVATNWTRNVVFQRT